MFLPDINVWLALTFQSHAQHAIARNWFVSTSPAACWFCRFTQLGFLRLATSRSALGNQAVTLVKAWTLYDAFLDDPRVNLAEEPEHLELEWRSYTHRRTRSPKLWSDAYLAAFAKASSLEIVTFDKGLRQYKGVPVKILS